MIKEILRIFGVASSLITNLNKCSLTPIQCEDQDLTVAQNFLPCSVVNFPYRGFLLLLRNSLGVLLWILWIRYQLPAWKAAELHPAGRVALVKSVLTAIRIYHLIALHCPKWVFKAIDKVRRGFVWKGRTNINGGHCSVAWTRVCRPLSLGGLGIHNLETLGWALNMRWLWLKKTQPDGPWSEFDIKTHTNAAALFASSVCSIIGNGATTLFWSDRWLYGICVASSSISNMTYPWKSSEKKQFGKPCWTTDGSKIFLAVYQHRLFWNFSVWDLIQEVQLQPGVPDQHHWLFTPSGEYTVHCKICIWSLSRWVNLLRACPKDLEELGTSALQILHMDGLSQ